MPPPATGAEVSIIRGIDPNFENDPLAKDVATQPVFGISLTYPVILALPTSDLGLRTPGPSLPTSITPFSIIRNPDPGILPWAAACLTSADPPFPTPDAGLRTSDPASPTSDPGLRTSDPVICPPPSVPMIAGPGQSVPGSAFGPSVFSST